jgi:hypothetical protein
LATGVQGPAHQAKQYWPSASTVGELPDELIGGHLRKITGEQCLRLGDGHRVDADGRAPGGQREFGAGGNEPSAPGASGEEWV